MNAKNVEPHLSFLEEVEKLKEVYRANKTIRGRGENSAEHSWHVALMALVLEEYAADDLDMLKVTKMLLIHDLVEIDAGDTWLYQENQQSKERLEHQAADRLFSLLPKALGEEYAKLWREFEKRLSKEAKFASAIDGIQPLLNHLITGTPENGTIPLSKVREKKAYIKEFVPKLWPVVEDLIEKSTEKGLYV